jgi:eukaryotic-like serine/threonine-protein kinase
MSSLRSTRALELSPSLDHPEDRAYFQRRAATFFLLVASLSAIFYVVSAIATAALRPESLVDMLWRHVETKLHIAGTLVAAVAGLYALRAKAPSASALGWADAIGTLSTCAMFGAMGFAMPVEVRPELSSILAVSYVLTTRAALLPSPPGRTALISTLGVTPAVVMIPFMYAGHEIATPTDYPLSPLRITLFGATWGLTALLCSACVSWVIYGLRREVRAAKQLGQYVLEDKLGEGGMGEVFRARHALLRRPTAIKLLTGTSPESLERFEREVRLTARLTHPNTVAIYDFGRTPDGVFYYAMELLEGANLEQLVEAHGAQEPARVVHFMLQVCGALEEAHAEGLVHRDIKPSNVIVTERGRQLDVAKVVDFGLVKDATGQSPDASHVNAILGTPYYMAPEAILSPEKIDGRADIYALGAVAYYLLTGETVFAGSSLVEVCSHHLHTPPPSLRAKAPDVPEELERIVMKCLEKKPDDRPGDAGELAKLLEVCGVEPWTAQDAHAWWSARGDFAAAAARATSGTRRAADMFGKTVAVALEGRQATS